MRPAQLIPLGLLLLAAPVAAQQPTATPAPAPEPLQVGTVAPDFTVTGATRYGVIRDPIHLSDFKGKTVVLAFFFKARTRG